ncbi:MAG: hypothetical protein QXH35_08915 [Nitrososphaerota archaeon]
MDDGARPPCEGVESGLKPLLLSCEGEVDGLAKAGREIIKRLTAPEIREIVREELSTALQPFMIKIEEMEKRITSMVAEFDKRLSSQVSELDKRLFSQISELDRRLSFQITELDKRLSSQISELDKRLSSQISELDKRLTSEISSLRSEVQYASRVAVLETKLAEIEKKLTETQ